MEQEKILGKGMIKRRARGFLSFILSLIMAVEMIGPVQVFANEYNVTVLSNGTILQPEDEINYYGLPYSDSTVHGVYTQFKPSGTSELTYYGYTIMPTFADVCGSSYWNGYTPPEGETFSGWQIYSITNEYNAGSEGYDFTIIFVPSFAASHTITYHISNGTNSSDNPTSYIEGVGVATIAAAMPDTGYEFGGWFDNPSYSGTAITSIPDTADTDYDLYAKITLEEYSITFNNNGGTFAEGYEPPSSYTLGTAVALPTADKITYGSYIFGGWYDNSDCLGFPTTFISDTATGNKHFYAKWRAPATYTITYNENGGEYVGEYEPPATYTEGVGATLPTAENISKAGSNFAGWHDNESLTGDPITAVGINETDNKEFWAEWTGKTAITPVVTMSDYEYDGTAHEATVSGIPDDYDGEITVTYSGTGTTTYASSTSAPKNAGTYSVSVTVTETANYASASAVVNYTIEKAPLYITPKEYSISFYDTSIDVTNAEKTGYIIDDSCLKTGDTPSSVYEGFNFDNYFTYQYMSYPAEGDFLQLYDRVGGDYDIVLYYDESVLYPAFEEKNPNYSIYPLYGKLNIVPKELTITWTNNTFPYDGDPHAPTASFDQNEFYYQSFDIPGESEPYIVSDFGDFNGAVLTITGYNVTEGKAINVGNYTATATLSFNDDDVAACYVIKEGDETYNFTITPTDLTVTAPEGINADYTGTAQELVSGGSVKFGDTTVGSFVYAVTSDTTEPGEGAYSADVPERTDAGTYYVWYKAVTENTNYNIPAPAYVTAKINPVSLTVTATTPDTISYGDAAPTYTATFTGLKGTDTPASVGTVTFSCTYGQGSDAGDYTITPTITTADRGAKYSNYSITFAEGTLTVSPKAVTVTITGHSDTKDYTGSEQSVSGYDASSDSDLYDTDYIVFSGTASAVGTNVGTYDMELAASQFSNSNTNFTVTFEVTDGSLTITAVPATVTAPDANNRIYDGAEKALVTGGSATGGTLVYALGTNETDAPTTFGDDVPVGTDVGDYYVWYYAKPDSNHTESAKGCVKVTITAASMTITAPNANNRDYDGTEDVLVTGGSVTGGTMKYALGNNETTAPIDDKFTTTVPTGTDAGDYYVWYWAVPLTGYSEDTSTPACEKVTINPKAIAVTITGHTDSVDYDAAEHTVSGYDAVCTDTLYDTLYDASKIVCSVSASVTGTNAGTYPMGLSADEFGYDDNNFSATFTVTDGQLEIKKAAINPSVSITGWTYGQTANTPVLAEGSNPGGATPVYKYKAASAADTTYTTTVPVNKGDYTLKVEIPETNNYLAGSDTADFTISPATLTIKADDIEIDYGSAIPDFTVTYDTLVNGDSAADIGVVTYTCSYTATSVASTYSIEPEVTTQGTAYSNYSISYENGTLTVNKLAITPTISIDESKVYDGLPITAATVSGNPGSGLVTFYYTGRDGTTYEASIPPTAVGKYSVYATVGESANYKAGVTGTADFEITAADISPSVSITGWTYGETPNAPSLADGSNPGGGEVKYFYIGRDGTTYEESEYVPTQAGKYTVKAVIPATDNYNGNVATADFTISPKTVAIEWTDTSLTYNGADQKPTATAANLETGDTCTITVDGAKKNASATAYTATATEVSNPNYKLPTENTTSFSITEKEIGINWGTTTFEYDGENHAPTATPTGVVDGDTCDITVTGAEKNVGTYTATASITNTNYKLPTENTTSFSITEKEIGINWTDTVLTYNGAEQKPTATPTGLISGDTCTITVSGAKKDVGNYTATASGLSNTNYKLPTENTTSFSITEKEIGINWGTTTFEYDGENHVPTAEVAGVVDGDTCTITVTGAEKNVGTYTATASITNTNYKLPTENTTSFSITEKEIGINWGTTTFEYDGENHAPTATPTGLVTGDSCDITVTGAEKNVGTYTATASITNTNYKLPTENTTSFSITEKEIGINWGTTTFEYDGENHAPTATPTGVVDGDTCTITVTGAEKNVGTYTATASITNTNYKLPTENTTSFSITEKEIGINWGTTTFEYDGENHAPTATPTGVVDGDTCTITVTGAEKNVGTYTATASITNTNYKLPTENTTSFSITEKEIGITWSETTFEYDGENHAPTATPTGVVDGDTCTITVTGAEKNVGTYTATASITNTNYKLPTENTTSFSITEKTIGIEWGTTTFEYDGENHAPTATPTGVFDGDTCTITVTGAEKNVGTYTATASITNTNYKLPTENTTSFSITEKEIGITWGETTFEYDGENHAPTATPTGVVDGDTCDITVTGAEKNVGTYTATASITNTNYKLPTENTTSFSITEKTIGIEWGTTTFEYDGENHAPTATPTGVVDGDTCTITVTGAEKNVGTYTATASITNTNYKLPTENTTSFSITAKAVTVKADDKSIDFGDDEPEYTATVTGTINDDVISYSFNRETGDDVGTYTITPYGETTQGNYTVTYETGTLTIGTVPMIVTAPTANTLTYNKAAMSLVTAGSVLGGTMKYALGTDDVTAPDETDFDALVPAGTNADTYYVWYWAEHDSNHTGSEKGCVNVTIAKADPDYVAPTAKENLIYNTEEQELLNEGSTNDGVMQYSDNGTDFGTAVPKKTDSGEYTLYYRIIGDANHNDLAPVSIKASIMYPERVITPPTAKTGLRFTGSPQVLIKAGDTNSGKMVYSLNDVSYSDDLPQGVYAGIYTVYYKVIDDPIHGDSVTDWINVTIMDAQPGRIVPTPVPVPSPSPSPAPSPAVPSIDPNPVINNEQREEEDEEDEFKITAKLNTSNNILINWTKVSEAKTYVLYADRGNGVYSLVGTTEKTSVIIKNPKNNTTYHFILQYSSSDDVQDKNLLGGTSEYQTSLTVSYPAKIKKITRSGSKVKITWGKVTGATKYKVCRVIGKKLKKVKVTSILSASVNGKKGDIFVVLALVNGKWTKARPTDSVIVR